MAGPALNAENRAVLDRFRAIAGHPDTAARDLRALVADAEIRLDLAAALDLFDERTGFIAARGLPIERLALPGAASPATSTTTPASSSR